MQVQNSAAAVQMITHMICSHQSSCIVLTSTLIQILIIFTLCCGNWRTHCGPAGWGGEALAWHSCVIQFSLELVSLFSLIYIVVSSTPTTTIFSIYFLMQPSGGGKQNEEGVLWFHQWTTLSIESVWKAPFNNIQRKEKHDETDELARTPLYLQYLLFITIYNNRPAPTILTRLFFKVVSNVESVFSIK